MNSCISLIFRIFLLLNFLLVSVNAQTDSSAQYRINKIKITGNKKTKDRIILRELLKNEDDTLILKNLPGIVQRSEFNIFNTLLFVYDSIQYKVNDTLRTVDYTIKVKERWYIWPILYLDFLDRNINTWWLTKDPDRLNYAVALSMDNFTGVKDRLIVIAKKGYADQFGFHYRLPYLDKKQSLGTYIQFLYTEYNKLQYITRQNKQQFLSSDRSHLRIEKSAKAGMFYRPDLFLQHSFDAYYADISISDSISDLNPNYFYKASNRTAFVGLSYKLTYDDRDNKIYPTQGNMFEVNLIKDGFDLSDASKLNTSQGIVSLKSYLPLGSYFNFANLIKARYLNAERVPFAFNQALGYLNYVRGYEHNVIDGQNYVLVKNSLRFQIVKKKYREARVLRKLDPFSTIPFYAYLNIYFDGAYVQEEFYEETNTLANTWQHGYGLGLDMITYYDFVVRLEYSVNKQNKRGFFIHLTSGF